MLAFLACVDQFRERRPEVGWYAYRQPPYPRSKIYRISPFPLPREVIAGIWGQTPHVLEPRLRRPYVGSQITSYHSVPSCECTRVIPMSNW